MRVLPGFFIYSLRMSTVLACLEFRPPGSFMIISLQSFLHFSRESAQSLRTPYTWWSPVFTEVFVDVFAIVRNCHCGLLSISPSVIFEDRNHFKLIIFSLDFPWIIVNFEHIVVMVGYSLLIVNLIHIYVVVYRNFGRIYYVSLSVVHWILTRF